MDCSQIIFNCSGLDLIGQVKLLSALEYKNAAMLLQISMFVDRFYYCKVYGHLSYIIFRVIMILMFGCNSEDQFVGEVTQLITHI